MNNSKLSDYQKGVIAHVREQGGELRRIPGGFWVNTQTIRSSKRKATSSAQTEFAEEWRDTRKLDGLEERKFLPLCARRAAMVDTHPIAGVGVHPWGLAKLRFPRFCGLGCDKGEDSHEQE